MEIFIALLLVILPNGEIGLAAQPVPSYSECQELVQLTADDLKLKLPEGTDIRTSCISSNSIGQNGV